MLTSDRKNQSESKGAAPLLSLALIVKDGGQLFAELLQEAAPWVDEIVVGDTGSTDNSREHARSAGATLLDVPWQDDFSAARNAVLEQCHGHWILVLDADEKIAPQDWTEIRNWVQDSRKQRQKAAVSLETRNYVPGRHSRRGWLPVPANDSHALPGGAPTEGYVPTLKIRLFSNHQGLHFEGCLHETVERSARSAGLPHVDLGLPVHHFGPLVEDASKCHRYLALAVRKVELEPHNPAAWSERADCAIACGDLQDALQSLDRALILEPAHLGRRLTAGWLLHRNGQLDQADMQLSAVAGAPGVTDEQLAEACHLRAQIAMTRDDDLHQQRVAHLLAVAFRLCPDNGHQLNTMGVWHLKNGRGEQARLALEKAATLLPGQADPWLNLAVLYEAAQQPERALQCAQNGLKEAPRSDKAQALVQRMKAAVPL